MFTAELADGVLGWLGLNHAIRHRQAGEAEVNPVVGVRHQVVERLVAELCGDRYHAYLPPTVSTPIGCVMPARAYVAWVFGPEDAPGTELAEAINSHGLPFMRSLIRLPALVDAIGQGFCHYPEYRLRVVLAVMGRHDDAVAALDSVVEGLGDRRDAAADRLRQFAAAFRRRDWARI